VKLSLFDLYQLMKIRLDDIRVNELIQDEKYWSELCELAEKGREIAHEESSQ